MEKKAIDLAMKEVMRLNLKGKERKVIPHLDGLIHS